MAPPKADTGASLPPFQERTPDPVVWAGDAGDAAGLRGAELAGELVDDANQRLDLWTPSHLPDRSRRRAQRWPNEPQPLPRYEPEPACAGDRVSRGQPEQSRHLPRPGAAGRRTRPQPGHAVV